MEASTVFTVIGLFFVWNSGLVGIVLYLSGRFNRIEKLILDRVSVKDYARDKGSLRGRIAALEHWALRLNGSVKIDFAEVSPPDMRAHVD